VSTIVDVAARAGVGVGTVSRVLNDSPLVSDKTRERVRMVIEELDYRPSHMARNLSLGRTLTVGVIVPFLTQAAVMDRIRGIVATLRTTPYDTVLFTVETPMQRAEQFRNLARNRVDGLLSVSLSPDDQEVERFRRAGIPVVLINGRHDSLPRVVTDDTAGGSLATRHLIKLGHQRIGFIGEPTLDPYGVGWSGCRQIGYRNALEAAGLPVRDDYQLLGQPGRAVAHRLTRELLKLSEPPTAIFVASDKQALGVMEAAQELGVDIPGQLSVIGFDDIDIAKYVGLSTVHQPLFESGCRGAELILEALQVETLEPFEEVLPLDLVPRRSTAAPSAA
jgi:LacI family transcriptional regulator